MPARMDGTGITYSDGTYSTSSGVDSFTTTRSYKGFPEGTYFVWGIRESMPSNGIVTYSFPLTFASPPFILLSYAYNTTTYIRPVKTTAVTSTSFTARSTSTAGACEFSWLAIGYV